ncbi:hypothetical protein K450DRAFT_249624 [Umbelopsis ramanniana AG]|uniref:Uncharacterized protein n=1 Tax=Umbelopsis ramanniana AG TaxID=1314678 RepID=A0AAD5HD65_UMBRA|nr:uncharacterized protein K450DRAFT_249624 [Umbelopsis ramanniana AG]KAI8577863.1 hypothetical protein K450DRAFT_249624 [Umbelopsis ramanniana AG]
MGKNFFSKVQDALAGSKNEEVPDKEKLPPPAAEEQEDQVPDEEKVPPPAAEEKEDQATDKEKTPAPATEEKEEQGLDKENSPAGLGDLKPFIARLPTFGESNEPIKRRHTDSYKRATTPEPLKENKPTSKSAEANKTTNDWFAVTPSNENVLQPFQARSPFTERRLNRNLLEDFKASIPTSTAASDDKPASSNTSRKRKLEGQKEEGRATYSRFKK